MKNIVLLFSFSCKFNSSEKIETKQIDTVQQIQEEKNCLPLKPERSSSRIKIPSEKLLN